jgi:hypothetical protein
MRTVNGNFETKKHTRTRFTSENLWFYGNESENKAGSKPKDAFRSNYESISQTSYQLNQPAKKSKDSTFIVDWQINNGSF